MYLTPLPTASGGLPNEQQQPDSAAISSDVGLLGQDSGMRA